eukprot:scaffold322249_cov23-Prasinocladus_malaysianus.AAC.1
MFGACKTGEKNSKISKANLQAKGHAIGARLFIKSEESIQQNARDMLQSKDTHVTKKIFGTLLPGGTLRPACALADHSSQRQ